MENEELDKIIGRYAEERKRATQKVAQEHFLAYAYLVCSADEVEKFLKRTRKLLTYYVDSLSLFENPFRNSQVCWLMLMFFLFCFSIFMMTDDDFRTTGIIICTGNVIYGISLWKLVWSKWLETSVLIAYYKEIIDLIDSLQLAQGGMQTA